MGDALDMSLDDLISKNKNKPRPSGGRGPTSGGGGPAPMAPRRRFNARAAAAPYHRGTASPAAPYHRGTASPFQARRPMGYATGFGAGRLHAAPMAGVLDEPTRLYISNLDYAVSNDDIKELFSDVGDIKRYSINYDRSGRSKGTAEVVFSRRSDAIAAVKRYNNVQLDGKPMKIEIIGATTTIESPPSPPFTYNPPAGNFKVPFTSVPRRGGGGGWPRGRGGFGGRGRGPASRGRGRGGGRGTEKVSAEDLDADLDKYHAAAMETS